MALFAQLGSAAYAGEISSTVNIFTGHRQVSCAESTQTRLRQRVLDLVKSSNFHSGPADKYHVFTFTGVQQGYRDMVGTGEYILMILSPAQKIETLEGEVTAAEIVVGRHGGGKNTVFTIDEAGTIVSHAKYSGQIYLELEKIVTQTLR